MARGPGSSTRPASATWRPSVFPVTRSIRVPKLRAGCAFPPLVGAASGPPSGSVAEECGSAIICSSSRRSAAPAHVRESELHLWRTRTRSGGGLLLLAPARWGRGLSRLRALAAGRSRRERHWHRRGTTARLHCAPPLCDDEPRVGEWTRSHRLRAPHLPNQMSRSGRTGAWQRAAEAATIALCQRSCPTTK